MLSHPLLDLLLELGREVSGEVGAEFETAEETLTDLMIFARDEVPVEAVLFSEEDERGRYERTERRALTFITARQSCSSSGSVHCEPDGDQYSSRSSLSARLALT